MKHPKTSRTIHHQITLPKLKKDNVLITSVPYKEKLQQKLETEMSEPPFNSTQYKKQKIKKKIYEDACDNSAFSKLRKELNNTVELNDNIRRINLFKKDSLLAKGAAIQPILKLSKFGNIRLNLESGDSRNEALKKSPLTISINAMNTEGSTNTGNHYSVVNTFEQASVPAGLIDTSHNLTEPQDGAKLLQNEGNPELKRRGSIIRNSIGNNKKQRLRTFKVTFIKNYNTKKNQNNIVLPKNIVLDLEFQSSVISDEIKVLLDSIETLRFTFFNSPQMIEVYRSIPNNYQEELNLLIEETVGLMLEISTIILSDFGKYLEKFISILPPSKERLKQSIIKNEEQTFIVNVKLFNDVSLFVKGCFEVYLVLLKQEDDISLSYIKYMEVTQYLARSRYNISSLIFRSKSYIFNHNEDMKQLEKYKFEKALVTKAQKKSQGSQNENTDIMIVVSKPNLVTKKRVTFGDIKKLKKIQLIERPRKKQNISEKYKTKFKKHTDRVYHDLGEKIRLQFNYKLNDNKQRMKRLNNILTTKYDEDENFLEKSKALLQNETSCLNSVLINKMMKFIPKELKHQIISQRIIERFKDKNRFSDDFDG